MSRKSTRRARHRAGWDSVPPEHELAHATSEEISRDLRLGLRLPDEAFDQFLSAEYRAASAMHWTPLVVAQRVAEWLEDIGADSVVDIGSGVGKFCVAAALTTRCRFTGVEQRLRLVDAARDLAKTFAVDDRVCFIHGRVDETTIPQADVYYLFNPFGENMLSEEGRLDDDVELGPVRYDSDVAYAEQFLEELRTDVYVIKYNGFGGYMPQSFKPVRLDRTMPEVLRMWHKPDRP